MSGVGLKKRKTVLVHKSYTDDGQLRMIIVKDQWTAILANFVRKSVMSSNSVKDIIACVMTDRGRKNLQVLSCTQSTCSCQSH